LTEDQRYRAGAQFSGYQRAQALEEQLRQLAFHDPLTLLANRTCSATLQHALTLAQSGQSSIAVMFLDLDNFKNINDSLVMMRRLLLQASHSGS